MFNFLRKSKQIIPPFEVLKSSPIKDTYFYRIAQWYWMNNDNIAIIDPHGSRVITLDPWPQKVFLDALGKITVTEYVDYVSSEYKKNVPVRLDETILLMIDKLVKERLILLSNIPVELGPGYIQPKTINK
ncbi:hypothetical protein HHL17_24395 [Chitinophaga sp. G-6-1-13]|uniref:PqqD family protein n=1 Tax=Chitinophaga fulva TaxID=2728842 RepID=A0A848GUP7_9BACT|nr:hypothetical protein [Chitinophaga fulva]NML40360.1 hypothetical protein [Chitinophaga fulva]